MKRLVRGRCYSHDQTDLAIKVNAIYYRCDDYTKVSCILYNKQNGIVYIKKKTFKLTPDFVNRLEQIDEIVLH